MHLGYRDMVLAKIRAAVESSQAASNVRHRPLKGQLREILIRDLFRPLLPADVGVGSGEIINHHGATSSQQDIILYDRSILPPILMEDNYGLIPVESVLYTIEVKTKVDRRDLEAAHKNNKELLLSQTWTRDCPGCSQNYRSLIPTVFAFSGGGEKAKDIVQVYDGVRGDNKSTIGAFCVVGSGYWYLRDDDTWMTHSSSYPYEEIVTFISGVMNTYRQVANSRHDFRLGFYLDDERMVPYVPNPPPG